jgi:hypothetical protein
MKLNATFVGCCLALSSSILSPTVFAQEEDETADIERIVVTAELRDEPPLPVQ